MKNHETTLITHEKPTKKVLIFRYTQTLHHNIYIIKVAIAKYDMLVYVPQVRGVITIISTAAIAP